MDIHPTALSGGFSRYDIYTAVEHALITTHIGNEPTRLLVIGRDNAGRLIELSTIVRHEDILVVFAAEARPAYLPLLDIASELAPEQSQKTPDQEYGISADGLILTEELIRSLFDSAERGYDVERLSLRTRPGRPAPLTVGGVIRLGLDPSLEAAVSAQARQDGLAIEELIERELRSYLAI